MNIKLNNSYINELLEYEKVQNGLYIVATPIGNLGDITIRSLKILSCVDLILCEDTKTSKKLINKYGIKTPLKPFHKFNSKKSIPLLIKMLHLGKSMALISDAGTPLISDPGADLIKNCEINSIKVFSIPGPSATIASFVLSNFSEKSFLFRGFFPRQKRDVVKEIDIIKKMDCPIIFFESPKRILKSLLLIQKNHGNCDITFVRELTKKNEEVINSNISNVISILKQRAKILGEVTFIINPIQDLLGEKISKQDILLFSDKLRRDGLNISEISRVISNDFNVSKRDVYQLLIKNQY